MVDIWREKVPVRFGDVDRSDRLTLGSVFSFFQDAAISHAEDLGVGWDALVNTGQAWILSRFSLFVERRPAFGEIVQVNSWPRSWEKLFALRDYEIRDTSGLAVVRGRAGWLIVDIEKRKPLRVQPILSSLPHNDGIDAFSRSTESACPPAVKPGENMIKKSERTALYSDIDPYGHVNNARYIQWIQDATDMDILTKAAQARLDINYVSEVKPGETVELWTAPLEDTGPEGNENPNHHTEDYPRRAGPCFAYEGRRPGSGQAVFRAELRTGAGT